MPFFDPSHYSNSSDNEKFLRNREKNIHLSAKDILDEKERRARLEALFLDPNYPDDATLEKVAKSILNG